MCVFKTIFPLPSRLPRGEYRYYTPKFGTYVAMASTRGVMHMPVWVTTPSAYRNVFHPTRYRILSNTKLDHHCPKWSSWIFFLSNSKTNHSKFDITVNYTLTNCCDHVKHLECLPCSMNHCKYTCSSRQRHNGKYS